VREVAATLRRHPSTIYRELKRNRHLDEHPLFRGYFPTVAQTIASGRRVRGGKIARKPELATYIADRLSAAWSPEQIAGYLRRHRGLRETVCHETIYQFVYGPDGRSQGLWRYLPVARRSRRQRYARKPRGLHIPVANTIGARPQEVADRRSFGHWEGDLLIFKMEYGKANLTSLIERRSRFTILARNPSRHSAGVMAGIQHHLRGMPPSLRQSITFDRGTEFAAFATLQEKLAMTSYFCLPSAPWRWILDRSAKS
jgi:IS30 family transposase